MAESERPRSSPKERSKEERSPAEDFEPYLIVRLDDEDRLKKLGWSWRKGKKNASGIQTFWELITKSEKGLLKNCVVELADANGLKDARITFDKPNAKIEISPKCSEVSQDHDRGMNRYILRHLRLDETYTVDIEVNEKGKITTIESIVFHTGPAAPSNFQLQINSLTWNKAKGAEKYHVQIMVPGSETEQYTTEDNKVTLKNCLVHGVDATVTITAISKSGLQKTSKDQSVQLGDMNAPHEIHAELNCDDPYRSIDVAWSEPPQGTPDEYKLKIFAAGGIQRSREESTTLTRHTFAGLISNQAFYAEVSALWGETPHAARSNTVTTEFSEYCNNRPISLVSVAHMTENSQDEIVTLPL